MNIFDLLEEKTELPLYDWMKPGSGFAFVLVTPDNIEECISECMQSGRIALDLETTGLDNRVFKGETKDKIVGVCLSGDGWKGFYIPLRHVWVHPHTKERIPHPSNIPWHLFSAHLRRLIQHIMEGNAVAAFHNGKFDQEFLEHPGGEPFGCWDSPSTWEDALILGYLRNSRARSKRLKEMAAAPPTADSNHPTGGPGLGMSMFELKDLFPSDTPANGYDFALLDPTHPNNLIYACSDAICTWRLVDILLPAVLHPAHGFSQERIYRIEKACVAATRWMERNRIPTSPERVMDLIKLGQQEWFDSILEVYSMASHILGRDVMPGFYKVLRDNWEVDNPYRLLPQQLTEAKLQENIRYPNPVGVADTRGKKWPLIYDVNAPKQLGEMFDEMAVPGLVRTENSGQVKTSKDVLEKVIERAEQKFPFMSKIRRFREVNKALSNYLYPMLEEVDPTDFTMRINFNGHKVDTGRFSTPARERELGESNSRKLLGWPAINFQSIPASYDPTRPPSMTRIRECIVAREGFLIVSIDFSGEELRLITNLSREPKWLDEFFRCSGCSRTFPRGDGSQTPPAPPARCPNCGSDKIGDIHTLTALELNGKDAIHLPEWKQLRQTGKIVNFALSYGGGGQAVVRATGCDKNEGWRVKQKFDGSYPTLYRWWGGQHQFASKHGFVLTPFGRIYPVPDIFSSDGGFRAKAERNAVNGPVQASGADICKIAMALIYKECKTRGWLDHCRMIATMHDELVFEIHESILSDALDMLIPTMTRNPFILAQRWPVPFTSDCEIGKDWSVPWNLEAMRYGEVRFEGNKKIKAPTKPRLQDYESPLDFEEALKTFPEKQKAWQTLPNLPSCLQGILTTLETQSTPLPESPAIVVEEMPEEDPKVFHYTLKGPLNRMVAVQLAAILHQLKGSGTRKLVLRAPDGTVLDWTDEDCFINEVKFLVKAETFGV